MLRGAMEGQIPDRGEFDAAVREGVESVVRRQVAAGVDVVNDGETGRQDFMTCYTRRLGGR
jgi:5-methyltetrahydropteroyltriglutamate--homocysteine methyltransferase